MPFVDSNVVLCICKLKTVLKKCLLPKWPPQTRKFTDNFSTQHFASFIAFSSISLIKAIDIDGALIAMFNKNSLKWKATNKLRKSGKMTTFGCFGESLWNTMKEVSDCYGLQLPSIQLTYCSRWKRSYLAQSRTPFVALQYHSFNNWKCLMVSQAKSSDRHTLSNESLIFSSTWQIDGKN